MEIAFGILGSVIQLAIIVGIVVFIVRLVGKRDKATSEGAGVVIRRFFQYTVMLGMLVLGALGLAGVVDAAAGAAAQVTQDTTAVARSIAFVVVGLPVYVGLAIYTARRLSEDPREQQSLGWAFYLTIALVGSLIAAMSLLTAFLGELLDERAIDRTLLINAVIWVGIWAGHWQVGQRKGVAQRMRFHLLLGSAAGLVAAASGAGATLAALLQQVYDALFEITVVEAGIEEIVQPLIVLAVGAPVWWWYWFRHARASGRTPWWLAYVILLGVLGGVVAVITGAGIMLFGVLEWMLGDPSATSAAVHFDFFPGALATAAVGSASWAYHRIILGARAPEERTEVDRLYDYLLSGAGLLVAAGGLATLVTVALDALGEREIARSASGDAVAAAITLLVIGVPLWWRHWSTIHRHRATDPEGELRSVTRRIYLFLLFGATAIVAVVNLIVLLFIVFEDILDGTLGATTLSSGAVPIALLLTAGALAWYHFAVFRWDRAAAPERERPALREVILVSADGEQLAEAIHARTGATVRPLRVVAAPTPAGSADDVLEALRTEKHRRVVVVGDGDGGFDVMPLAD